MDVFAGAPTRAAGRAESYRAAFAGQATKFVTPETCIPWKPASGAGFHGIAVFGERRHAPVDRIERPDARLFSSRRDRVHRPATGPRFFAMDRIRVTGGQPLHGAVRIAGAKNAALPAIAAAILTEEPIHLTNVPDVRDVTTMLRVLERVGAEWDAP